MSSELALSSRVRDMLHMQDIGAELTLTRITDGGNNRVYKASAGAQHWCVKHYFRDAADPRDRFATECGFLALANSLGIANVPQLIAANEVDGISVTCWIRGRKLLATEIDTTILQQAIQFVSQLNQPHVVELANDRLLSASEACFAVSDHIRVVDRRVQRMVAAVGELPAAVATWVDAELTPTWATIRAKVAAMEAAIPLTRDNQIVSPSDFGFHNALFSEGKLCFFDFEYAGWDDPAKLCCDFFCQPAIAVDRAQWSSWLQNIALLVTEGDQFIARANLLYPLYQVKWCCIMLNEFMQSDSMRRAFSNEQWAHHKNSRFNKAQHMLLAAREVL